MPLQLGDVSTERPQLIMFNAEDDREVADAAARADALKLQGFVLREEEPGRIAFDPPARAPHLGVFRVLSEKGDDRIVWDRRIPAQVKEAFQKFTDFLKKGYAAYATLSTGRKGHKIESFDPGLEEIILVPSTMPG